ncbi:hypothetical protein FKG94_26780 [Exilibacterium tricleocarpae]|uniref:DUF3592 domain-containing protein n=1 Tax=Exilibacterium tricleocarpae TaxID=2591008 RepID=A0A545SNZ3_9GAMM|nr:hypothetical protein [Exilibacterium tricleocarpae]TQV66703.1 hypothetical protein FKG94_26780 [Exilibacterium tricleocarpae]
MFNRDNFRTHKPWRENRFYSTAARNFWLTLLALVVCAVISAVLLHELNSRLGGDWRRFNAGALLFMLMPLVTAVIAVDAVRQWLGLRRYGRVALEMDPYPGCIGGQVGGRATFGGLPAGARVQVLLSCIYVYISQHSSERRRTERVEWCDEGIADSHAMGGKTLLTFAFDVPGGLPPSTPAKGDYHYWQVTFAADVPGVDLKRRYRIPVFAGRERARGVIKSTSAKAAGRRLQAAQAAVDTLADGALEEAGLGRAVQYRRDGDSEFFYYPMGRHWLGAVFSAVFGVGFSWAVLGILAMGSHSLAGLLFAALFASPFALIAVGGVALALYFAFSSLWVSVTAQGVLTKRCLFGLSVLRRMVPAADTVAIRVQQTSSVSRDGRATAYFSLYLVARTYPELKVGEDIEGRELADALAAYLRRRLGVKEAPPEDVAEAGSVTAGKIPMGRSRLASAAGDGSVAEGTSIEATLTDNRAPIGAMPDEVISLLQEGHRVAAVSRLKNTRRGSLRQAREEIDRFLRDTPQLAQQPPDRVSRLVQQLEPYLPALKFAAKVYPYLIAVGLFGMLATRFHAG